MRWRELDEKTLLSHLQNLASHGKVRTHRAAAIDEVRNHADRRKARAMRKASEAEILSACLALLAKHPKVALSWRQNSGVARFGQRVVRFSFRGCSDILAILRHSGRLLAIEVKAEGKRPTEDQEAFLQAVRDAGGLACCVTSASQLASFLGLVRHEQIQSPAGG